VGTPRGSLHVAPVGARAIAQHYLRDLVYGANDGIITTFAVVAGVAGGALSERAVLADGLSMAVGNYLGIRSHESARRAQALPEEEAQPVRHGLATFLAFAVAGALPLLPYLVPPLPARHRFALATLATLAALFGVGSARAAVTDETWWASGLEMLGLGIIVAGTAYAAGAFVAAMAAGA
jgi:VIT1/CCC1 family predicted Fe2+/Mn2+ transporter